MIAYPKIALASLTLGLLFVAVNPAIALAWHYQAAPADTAQAQRISQFVAAQDWLGPISSIALCSFVFFASKRAIVYFKEIYIRPTIAKVLGTPSPATEKPTVFLANGWNGFPRRTRGKIILNPDGNASKLILTRWFTTREFELKESAAPPTIQFLSDTLRFDTSDGPVNLEAQKGVFALNDTNASMPIPQGA